MHQLKVAVVKEGIGGVLSCRSTVRSKLVNSVVQVDRWCGDLQVEAV